jgi:hypothetical protein
LSEISEVVDQAIARKFVTPLAQEKINQLASGDMVEGDYQALEKLMNAVLKGQVIDTKERELVNVWGPLAIELAIEELASPEWVIPVAEQALNFLAPAYATKGEAIALSAEVQRWALPMIRGAVQSAILLKGHDRSRR